MNNPNAHAEMLRELAGEFRKRPWQLTDWKPSSALVDRSGGSSRPYQGQPYDDTYFQVVDGGWTHDHCEFCWATIRENPDDDSFASAYTDGDGRWICPVCYHRIFELGEDAATVFDTRWDSLD